MSFSSQTKEELSKLNNLASKSDVQAELIGYIISNNCTLTNDSVKFSTESDYNINRFAKLLNNLNILDYQIELQGKIFAITTHSTSIANAILSNNLANQSTTLKAIIRGLFLGSGSMNNPENEYHLEIALSSNVTADLIQQELETVGIKMKKINTKNSYALYIKDGEEISKFLALIGANKSMLEFEEIRVKRHMNNKVNRLVNCETANMNKTINAAVEQIEAIRHLKETNNYYKLDDNLKEIAQIRLKYPNLALSELGQHLKKPIGKSGVNYRLKKIIEIAKEN